MKNNSASRLHNIINGWRPVPNADSALIGWLRVFGFTSEGHVRDYVRVNQQLQLLLDERAVLIDKLSQRQVSEAVYGPSLQKLEQALSPALLSAQAQHVKQHLTDDVYTGLGFCSELIPIEEDSISEQDFRDMVGLINQLELLLLDNTFPSGLTAVIRRHVRLAEMALAQYPIRGAVALRDAVKSAVGDLVLEPEVLASAKPENARLVTELWKKANSLADAAIKADNLLQLGGRVIKLLEISSI